MTALQALAARHVAFSLTEACPLHCSHCIVSTVSPSNKTRTMSLEDAERYASEMPRLRERGVEVISFTGGEPLLAPHLLHLLSDAASRAGMSCTVVTACHWATSRATAERTIAEYPQISHWHLSTDLFHEEFIPRQHVLTAAAAAQALGRAVQIRMAASMPPTTAHEELYLSLRSSLPSGVPVVVQPVTSNGRGSRIASEHAVSDAPAWPCMPNGMVVRFDGTISPCCAGLVDQRDGHPFQYARAREVGVAAAHDSWCTDPLLQLIRAVGFRPLLRWVEETFPGHPFLTQIPRHPCECCLRLWKDDRIVQELRRRAERPENRAKIALLVESIFGETFFQQSQERPSTLGGEPCPKN